MPPARPRTSSAAPAQLSAPSEYIGYGSAATALFQQTGGTNTADYLSIGSGGNYQLTGGTLQITNGGLVDRALRRRPPPASLRAASCIMDLSQGTLQNIGACR